MARTPIVTLLSVVAVAGLLVACGPPYIANPFCESSGTYRQDAEIEIGGERLRSSIVRQESRSRDWIAMMNSSGCGQERGTVLPFRTSDNIVVLLRPAALCEEGKAALKGGAAVDLVRLCPRQNTAPWSDDPARRIANGFIIDNAEAPKTWRPFHLQDPASPVKVVSMTSRKVGGFPSDDLDSVAPGVLKARFDTEGSWWNSPEAVLPVHRRYGKKNTPPFEVKPAPSDRTAGATTP